MRTVGDIIEACQEQQPATEEELRLALLSLYYALNMSCSSEYERERKFLLLKQTPEHWLGERYTPGTEANSKGREQSKAVLAAFEKSRKP